MRLVSRVDVNGFATGALQVFCEGAWGAVCTSNFDDRDALVACRQLGFTTGVSEPVSPGFRRVDPDPVRFRILIYYLCLHSLFWELATVTRELAAAWVFRPLTAAPPAGGHASGSRLSLENRPKKLPFSALENGQALTSHAVALHRQSTDNAVHVTAPIIQSYACNPWHDLPCQ